MKVPRRYRAALVPAAVAAAAIAACIGSGDRPPSSEGRELTVAVSIPPQAWLVERVGGKEVGVITLLSPGDSPATYQPTDIQISRLIQADVYFRVGVPFENGRWFQAVQTSGGPEVVDFREGVALRLMEHTNQEAPSAGRDHTPEADEGADPHIWLSPRLLKIQAATVAEALRRINPRRADEIQANLADILNELDGVDTYVRDKLSALQGRAFYVFHPAWGYFADEYGLRQEAIEIEGKEPSDHELTEFQVLARRDRVSVIFVQPQIAGESARAAARAIGADINVIDPLAYGVASNLRRVADAIAEALR